MTSTKTTTPPTTATLPARQVRWTRLGVGMGYTNTEPKRAAIRTAIEAMVWVDPEQLRDVLDACPVRYHVAGLFYRRVWALAAAAVEPLPADATPPDTLAGERRLIGLESVDGERYVLLDLGYEAIDVLHDTPTTRAQELSR